MKGALPPEALGKPLEIWFQDEARVGQKGTLTRIWARIGSRPRAPRDTRYKWAYIFGAVCPQRAVAVALVLPFANCQAMNLHLREISRNVSEEAPMPCSPSMALAGTSAPSWKCPTTSPS